MRIQLLFQKRPYKQLNTWYLAVLLFFSMSSLFAQEVVANKYAVENAAECNQFDITLEIIGNPPAQAQEVVLVIDRSGSMDDGPNPEPIDYAQDAAIDFVNNFFLPANNPTGLNRVSVVSFSNTATIDIGLTGSSGQASVINAINSIVTGGGTNTEDGIVKADNILSTTGTFNCFTSRNIILLSDGVSTVRNTNSGISGCGSTTSVTACQTEAIQAGVNAQTTTVSGVVYNQNIFTIGLVSAISGTEQVRALATLNGIQNAGAYSTENNADLTGIYNQILGKLVAAATQIPGQALVSDTVQNGFSVVPGSINTSKGTATNSGSLISWFVSSLYDETITLTYTIESDGTTGCGNQVPGNSVMNYEDSNCNTSSITFANPNICSPCPTTDPSISRVGCTNSIEYESNLNQGGCSSYSDSYQWVFKLNGNQVGTANTENGTFTYSGAAPFEGDFSAELTYSGSYGSGSCSLADVEKESNTITLPPAIVISLNSKTDVSCLNASDGDLDISVSGGTGSFTYDWDNNGLQDPDSDSQDLSNLAAGTYTVIVTDSNSGCTETESFEISTIPDNIDPTITCPAAVSVPVDAGTCATDASNVTLGTPTTSDNCSVASVTNDAPASYPLGETIVTWTVTDGSGNTATCTQVVTVVDNIDPTITCPAAVSVPVDAGTCATDASNVTLGTPTTSDNCSVASVTNDAPASYPLGDTTVTWTVTDGSGNTATCTQVVTVTDNIDPTIICPAAVLVNVDAGTCATDASNVTLGTPTTSDNCSVASVTNDAPTSYPLGDTTVTWTVTDGSGNTATCTQVVTVTDNIDPTITCPAAVLVNVDAGTCATDASNVTLGTPTTSDNCSVASVTNDAPASYPLGDTTVTWTVTDGSGNTATCTQTVTVTDNIDPTITCPAAVSVNVDAGTCATDASNVTLGTPTTSDNCSIASVTNDAPASYPLGDTTVTWTVTDGSGNTATCTQNVTVIDNIDPTITCPAAVSVPVDAGTCATDASNVTLGTPTTSDNCSVASVTNDAPASYPLGDTIVTWTVTDGSGNTATCTQTVTVTDNIDPTITCPAAVLVPVDAGTCATDASNVTLGTPTTSDNCSVASVTNDAPASYPLGDTTVTWTVTDGSGNTATCTQTVTVTDNIDPTITCPAAVLVPVDAGTCATDASNVTLGTPTTSDNCSVASVTNDAPASYPLGDTTVTWTVTDGSGNTATCTQTVTVTDNIDPTITCPAAVSVNVDAGTCATDASNVTLGTPTTSDNCSVASVTNDAPASYPLGDTTVTWTVTDGSGNTATCTQVVTVVDNIDPTIICPAAVSVPVDAGTCATDASNVTLGTPTTSDNCSVASVTNDAPASYPLGDTTVTWTVTDGSGNTATCTQTVTVVDNIDPTIICPAAVLVNVDAGTCATDASNVTLGTPTTSDNCSVASVTNDAPASYPLGDTTVTWTVTDGSGNTATCTQTVTVVDNIDPTITCPAAVLVNVDAGTCATDASNVTLGTPTTSDNCSVASVTNDAPASYPLGDTTVTWTVTDGSGNTATCTQTVTVVDNIDPTITCPTAVSVNVDAGTCATDASNVTLGTPTTSDNCSVASVTNDAPASYPLGDTTVTWTVTDGSGNTATCTQTVTVTDNIDPTIICPAAVLVNVDAGTCATDASNVTLGTPTTSDNCSVASVTNDAPASYPLGDTTVTWTVTDGSGNTATCTQTVTVVDNIDPTIICPAAVSVPVDAGTCATDASNVTLGTPTTSDNCSVASVTNDAPASYPLGDTTVTWTVTDGSGNTATCTQTVTVVDNIDPTIICPAAVLVNVDAGTCATDASNVTLGTPTTSDNCSVASVTNDAPASYPLGDTTVTWTVTDGSGNTATCTQTVTVVDNIDPTITCPAAVLVNVDAGTCATDASNVTLGTPTTSDNCSVASVTNDAPASYPLGDTTVTWTVTDGSGNTATCTQTVTVVDNIDPTITCPTAVSVNVDAGTCATDASNVTLGTPTTSDNCSVASVTNDAPASYPLGDTTVTWTVTDGSGNTATCTQTVTVTDNIDPTITCPAAVLVPVDAGTCATDASNVTLGTPTTSDNCSVASVTNDAPASYPLGDTTVTWTVTDGSGNTATCTQTVTVTDNIDPTITCPAAVLVPVDAGTCATDASNVTLGTPTTSDNCSIASVTNDAPASYPLGDTTVTWTVTDGSGNTATCTQTVTVTDNIDPTITCPAAVLVPVDAGTCATDASNVTLGTPTTSDNCSVASVTNDAPASYPLGDTTVTWTVTDGSGNTATCTQVVTVVDNIDPTIICPAAVSVPVDAGTCATDASNVTLGTPTTSDNCSVASVTNDAPASYPLGDTTVTWTVTDGSGNTATCTQVVTVTDNIDPTITCPAAVLVNVDAGTCATDASNVTLGTPTTSDNCSVASVTNDAPASYPLGDTTVTWTVTDGSGNTATCTQTVTVVDNIDPTIICPAAVLVNVDAGTCATDASNVTLGTPTTSDNCSVASVTNDAPASYPLGDTTVTWTVTDGSGNTATCTQVVTVTDNIDPTIICPAAVLVNVDAGTCATDASNVTLGTPTTSDNCSVASVTNDAPASYPLGDTTVTWTVTDGSGNTATCTQTVTVVDNIDPTIICPAAVSVNVDAGTCATDASNVTLGTPTTSDNCSVASVTNDAPASYPLGDTTVTWTVTDGSGNTATCTQTVTVVDNIDPTIICPAAVLVNVDAGTCATDASNVTLGTPTTSDNCSVASVTNDAPASYPLGDTTVTWTVTDGSGNTATCTQVVTVTDNIDPTIICPAAVLVNVDAGTCATDASNVTLGTPTTSDNCSVASVTNDAPASYPLGDTTVTWTVTDGSGNTATCTQTVTVVDNIDPTIICPAAVLVNVDAGTCATDASNVTLGTPTTSDNCSVASVTNDAPASYPLGDTTVTWTVTDGSGNTATCTQTVTVVDNIDPTIICPAAVLVNVDAGTCATDASNVTLGTPTTSDNCSVASVTNDAPASYPLGDTTVTWTVTDGSGNTATCTQTVTVIDNIDPTFVSCAAPVDVNVDANGCTTDIANINLGTPTVDDNCTTTTITNDAPSTFPLGETIVTWTVTDGSGNTATCTQTVTVIDNIDPTFVSCAAPLDVNVDANGCTTDIANINLGTPTVDDNCTTTIITNDAPSTFPLGETIVTWTVTDGSGNTATCTQTVTVIDNIDPTFVSCAAPVDVNVDANGCTTDIANINLGTPTVDDNCTTTTITNDAPSTFPLGETIVTWTVTDGSGNTATCTQTVTVIDNIDPTFVSCAAPLDVNVDANGCTTDIANINLGTPTVDDNCTTTTITNDAPSTFPLGETIVTWTVTDGSGNTATCTQTVTVIDNIDPTFVSCAAPVDVNVDANGCTTDIANINLGTPTVDDNCTTTTITNDAPNTFPLGETIVTWTVTDGSGNTATCTQTVTVIDNIDPTFVSCAAPVDVNVDANGCTTDIANINLGTPTVDDNCTTTTITNDAPNTFPLGETIVTWTVTDGSGNTATCTQTVTVIDNIDPTFVSCAAPLDVNVDANGCTTDIANINLGTPTVDDNCTTTTITNDAPSTFPLGETIVTWTVTDGSGNTATCTQTVTVIDNIDPTFVSCAAPVSVNVDTGGCSTEAANINLGTPIVDDNCTTTTITNDAPSTFPLGETIVTWTVTDGSGNTATCTQTVTVIDNDAPIFIETLPSDGTFECDNVPNAPSLNASDPCGDVDVQYSETRTDGSCDSNYILERKWIATDQNGLSTTHVQILTIQDTKAPELVSNLESSITVNCESIPEIPALEFIDNCSNNVNVIFEEVNNFDQLNPSDYNIVRTWTVSDDCNNKKVFTQTVNIILNNIVTTLNDRACYDDGAIDLNKYLEDNQSGGNWTVIEGNARLDQNVFNPENVVLGTYKFSYSIADGSCLNTVELSIEIHDECIPLPCGKEDVIVSKVVTPNGDPHNEYFTITGVETCGFVIELQIFNRWGAKIYDNLNYQNNWNGFTHNSSIGKAEKVPNGTYFYIINLKNSGLEPIAKAFYVGTK